MAHFKTTTESFHVLLIKKLDYIIKLLFIEL